MVASSSSVTDEEEEVHEDDRADTEAAPSSNRNSPPPSPMMMTHPMRCKMIVVMVAHPIGCQMVVMTVVMRLVRPRLPCQKRCLQGHTLEEFKKALILPYCTSNSSAEENRDDGAKSLLP
jgi:hypothetical protein